MEATTVALPRHPNHSAIVEMRLTLDGGEIVSVGQLGPSFLILDRSLAIPPCEGEMMLSVDGRERRWRVSLPEGVRDGVARTPIKAISSVSVALA